MSMLWQRFTERAKRAVIAAQEEAARTGASYVCPEHLLLAMVKESDSVATKVLERLGAAVGELREEMERQFAGGGPTRDKSNMTLDPRMKRVLDHAYDEAAQSNTNYIGTEHLLLGIIREGAGAAYLTLAKQDVDIVSCRKEVTAYLGGQHPAPPMARRRIEAEVPQPLEPESRPSSASLLDRPFSLPGLTEWAKLLLEEACFFAAQQGSRELLPRHLLLALAHSSESVAGRLLVQLGVTTARLQEALASQEQPAGYGEAAGQDEPAGGGKVAGQDEPAGGGKVAGRDRVAGRGSSGAAAKVEPESVRLGAAMVAVLGCSAVEARRLKVAYVGPEHLLLGVLREQDEEAAGALHRLGITAEGMRSELRRFMGTD